MPSIELPAVNRESKPFTGCPPLLGCADLQFLDGSQQQEPLGCGCRDPLDAAPHPLVPLCGFSHARLCAGTLSETITAE